MDYLFAEIWACLGIAALLGAFLYWILTRWFGGTETEAVESHWREKLDAAQQRIDASKNSLTEAASTNSRLEQTVAILTDKLETSETGWEKRFEDLGVQVTEKSDRVTALEKDLRDLAEWKTKYDDVVVKLEEQKSQSSKAATEWDSRIAVLSADLDKARATTLTSGSGEDALRADIAAELTREWQGRLDAKVTEYQSLMSSSQKTESALEACEQKSVRLNSEWHTKEVELTKRLVALETDHSHGGTELSEMRSRITDLEADLATTKAQRTEQDAQLESLRSLAATSGDIGALRSRVSALQEQLDRSKAKNTDLHITIATLQSRLMRDSDDISDADRFRSQRSATTSRIPKSKKAKSRVAKTTSRTATASQKAPIKRSGHYMSFRSEKDKQFYFRFMTDKSKIVLRSEGYTSKRSCENGIRSVLRNASDPARIRTKVAKSGKHFFDVVAKNGETVGTSMFFSTRASMRGALELFNKRTKWIRVQETKKKAPTSKAAKKPSRRKTVSTKRVSTASRDDLKKIHGIGPVLEKLLNKVGVRRFRQIAHWSAKDIERFSKRLDTFPNRIRRDRWIQGARREHLRKYGDRL